MEAVEAVLREARAIAKTMSPEKRAYIEQLCSEIEAMAMELAALQAKGEVCFSVVTGISSLVHTFKSA